MMANRKGNFVAVFDQCQFGLRSPRGNPMQKRTRFLTNLKPLYEALNGKVCDHSHEHDKIEGSQDGIKLSVHAQTYPDQLVETICRLVLDNA